MPHGHSIKFRKVENNFLNTQRWTSRPSLSKVSSSITTSFALTIVVKTRSGNVTAKGKSNQTHIPDETSPDT